VRVSGVVATVAVAVAVTGCGSSEHQQVQAKVQQFVTAVRAKDYATLCDSVLAPVLLLDLKEFGVPCPQAMRISFGRVRSPSLAIGNITVSGDHASVVTLSGAKGQDAALASIELVRTADGWRVNSLGSPLTARR
jgi:ketosteroid isomerase-like protein